MIYIVVAIDISATIIPSSKPISRIFLHLTAVTSVLLLLVNLSAQSPLIGLFAFIGMLFSTSLYLGSRFFRKQPLLVRFFGGITISTALLAILGAILYYITPLNPLILTSLLSAYTLGCALFARPSAEVAGHLSGQPPSIIWLFAFEILFLLPWWKAGLNAVVTEALRSPWDSISPALLLPFALAALCAVLIIRFGNRTMALASTSILLLSGISVAVLAYPIGFGFDPFIHQATVAHILEYGTITPKPFYYIGQYALELILSGVFLFPLSSVDQWLIPLLTAIIVPVTFLIGATKAFKVHHNGFLVALFFLPLAPFIFTTPQSLAYLFTAGSLFLALPVLAKESEKLVGSGILAVAAMMTHPLAGIPALLFFVLAAMTRIHTDRLRRGLIALGLTGASISLPVVFFIQAKLTSLSFSWDVSNIIRFSDWAHIGFSPWLSLVNALSIALPIIVMCLALWGTWIAKRTEAPAPWHLPLLAAGAWMINLLVLRGMKFDFLIEYEQDNYAQRLLILTIIFLLPAVATTIATSWETLKKNASMMQAITLCLVIVLTGTVYLSYPRNDGTVRSAGFNVSQYDIEAARAIETHANGTDYVVLSNQAVSAAALREFGFARYFEDDLFYYPIPTSSPLYGAFLEMADEEPSRDTAEDVLEKTGAEQLYFVLNDYWWDAEATAEAAKQEADDWFAVGSGSILIFVFE
jgi:hypothetical protein